MSEKMRCPECNKWTDVLETRPIRGTNIIYRRRECGNGHRFTTHETFHAFVKPKGKDNKVERVEPI